MCTRAPHRVATVVWSDRSLPLAVKICSSSYRKDSALLMLYLGVCPLPPLEAFISWSVAVLRWCGLEGFQQPVGPVAARPLADDHPVLPHAHVNGITLLLRNCCFGTTTRYCFQDASLGPNLAAFLYIELLLILNSILISMVLDISGFYRI